MEGRRAGTCRSVRILTSGRTCSLNRLFCQPDFEPANPRKTPKKPISLAFAWFIYHFCKRLKWSDAVHPNAVHTTSTARAEGSSAARRAELRVGPLSLNLRATIKACRERRRVCRQCRLDRGMSDRSQATFLESPTVHAVFGRMRPSGWVGPWRLRIHLDVRACPRKAVGMAP